MCSGSNHFFAIVVVNKMWWIMNTDSSIWMSNNWKKNGRTLGENGGIIEFYIFQIIIVSGSSSSIGQYWWKFSSLWKTQRQRQRHQPFRFDFLFLYISLYVFFLLLLSIGGGGGGGLSLQHTKIYKNFQYHQHHYHFH